MVRRSVLVYDFLRTEQPADGFSQKEIAMHLSGQYDIAPGKTLHRDIAIALRRGLDFGILSKKGKKFRFDANFHEIANLRRNMAARRPVRKPLIKKRKGNGKKRKKRKTAVRSNTVRNRQRQRQRRLVRSRTRKQTNLVPRPRLPRPPSWSPKRRYLAEEPIPKIRHT